MDLESPGCWWCRIPVNSPVEIGSWKSPLFTVRFFFRTVSQVGNLAGFLVAINSMSYVKQFLNTWWPVRSCWIPQNFRNCVYAGIFHPHFTFDISHLTFLESLQHAVFVPDFVKCCLVFCLIATKHQNNTAAALLHLSGLYNVSMRSSGNTATEVLGSKMRSTWFPRLLPSTILGYAIIWLCLPEMIQNVYIYQMIKIIGRKDLILVRHLVAFEESSIVNFRIPKIHPFSKWLQMILWFIFFWRNKMRHLCFSFILWMKKVHCKLESQKRCSLKIYMFFSYW